MLHVKEVLNPMTNGVTNPFHCILDTGDYAIVKTFNNIQSNMVLINEFICYELALFLNLPMLESGVCLISENTVGLDKLIEEDNDKEKLGLAFYSKRIDKSTVLTGLKMVDLIENKHDILKIIVFDHLIYNADRNKGNLIFSFKKKNLFMYVIDHTHVFHKQCLWDMYQLEQCIEDNDYLDTTIIEKNSDLYSLFFQREDMPLDKLLEISKEYKEKINENNLREIINRVPKEWNLSYDDGEALIKYLLYRLDKLDHMCKIIYENKSK